MSEDDEEAKDQAQEQEWNARQDQIDQWVVELGERLKLDQAALTDALLDWVYVHSDSETWRKAWEKDEDPAQDILEQIQDLIATWRNR